MLLANRRIALIHLCLAGMQAAWIVPPWLLLYRDAPVLWGSYTLLLAALLAWMLLLELLSRTGIQSPIYDLISLGLMAVTSLLVVRLMLHPEPAVGLSWLRRAASEAREHQGGLPPMVALVGFNLVLWQRATAATSQDTGFFGVGVAFRLGFLLLLGGGAACSALRGLDLLPLVWLYLVLGLTAVALARISEKATSAHTAGVPLPMRRLLQLLLAASATAGGVALVASAYTPESLRRLLHLLDPLWQRVTPLLLGLLLWLARLLDPILVWLEGLLVGLIRGQLRQDESGPLAPVLVEQADTVERLLAAPLELLKDALILLVVGGSILSFIMLLLLFLERVRHGERGAESEEEGAEEISFGGGLLGRGLTSLRSAARLVRRVGLSHQLLAAISVQNIYANLCRIAQRRGLGRLPSQPPDDYLPALRLAFPGHDEALSRITAAYMRVHYGDHPPTAAELARVREDYRAVRETKE